jgi:hypothetical protein
MSKGRFEMRSADTDRINGAAVRARARSSQLLEEAAPQVEAQPAAAAITLADAGPRLGLARAQEGAAAPLVAPEEVGDEGCAGLGGGEEDHSGDEGGDGDGEGEGDRGAVNVGGRLLELGLVAGHVNEALRGAGERGDA